MPLVTEISGLIRNLEGIFPLIINLSQLYLFFFCAIYMPVTHEGPQNSFCSFFFGGCLKFLKSIEECYRTIIRNYEIISLSKQHHYMKIYLHIDSARHLPNRVD